MEQDRIEEKNYPAAKAAGYYIRGFAINSKANVKLSYEEPRLDQIHLLADQVLLSPCFDTNECGQVNQFAS